MEKETPYQIGNVPPVAFLGVVERVDFVSDANTKVYSSSKVRMSTSNAKSKSS